MAVGVGDGDGDRVGPFDILGALAAGKNTWSGVQAVTPKGRAR